jgi:hypothetical protein
MYPIFQRVVDNSGFGWAADAKVVTAPDEVWEEYINAHKKAGEFRDKPLQFYDELHEIYSGNVASVLNR